MLLSEILGRPAFAEASAGGPPLLTGNYYWELLAGGELDQLDRLEIHHVAAHPLGGVEVHEGLGGEGITQDAHALAVDDQVALAEIAEGDGQAAGGDGRHIFGLDHGE